MTVAAITLGLSLTCVVGLLLVGWQLTFLLGELKLMREVITYRLSGSEVPLTPPPWIEKPAIGDVKFHIPNILHMRDE